MEISNLFKRRNSRLLKGSVSKWKMCHFAADQIYPAASFGCGSGYSQLQNSDMSQTC